MICFCVLRAFVSYYLFCCWSGEELREEDGEEEEGSVVLIEKDEF